MITLGLDPHPDSHTVAALDENGSMLASMTVPNTYDGLAQLHRFALQVSERRWAIEGAANRFILCFVNELLEQGEVPDVITDELLEFPERLREQAQLVRRLLQDAGRPLSARYLTARFRLGRTERVEEIVEMLVELGQARQLGEQVVAYAACALNQPIISAFARG